jgi:hypothetical protein
VKFVLQVGETEKHLLEYQFNQLLGSLVIKVNHQPVKRCVRLFNEPCREAFDLVIGEQERSFVRIEKERGLLFGQRNKIFVNNRLTGIYQGV